MITAVSYTIFQPKDGTAQVVHTQYLEAEQLTLEDVESDGSNMWSMWKRDLSSKNVELPIDSNQDVTFRLGEKELTMKVHISQDQLMVVSKPLTQFLNIEHVFYEESEILQLSKGEQTLVFRGSTEIVYENGVKTPSSAKALRQGPDLLVPINVIANGFGYKLKWNEEQQVIELTAEEEE